MMTLTNLWPSDSRSNWNLEALVFEERGKPEYLEMMNEYQLVVVLNALIPFLEKLFFLFKLKKVTMGLWFKLILRKFNVTDLVIDLLWSETNGCMKRADF